MELADAGVRGGAAVERDRAGVEQSPVTLYSSTHDFGDGRDRPRYAVPTREGEGDVRLFGLGQIELNGEGIDVVDVTGDAADRPLDPVVNMSGGDGLSGGYPFVIVPTSQPSTEVQLGLQETISLLDIAGDTVTLGDLSGAQVAVEFRDLPAGKAIFMPFGKPVLSGDQPVPRTTMGTVAHWRFDGGAVGSAATGGGSLVDAVGGFRGTPFGGPVYRSVDGRTGLEFDGVDDRIFVPDHPSFAMTGSFTLEAVIRYDGISPGSEYQNQIVFRGDDRGGLDPYSLSVSMGERLFLLVGDSAGNYVRVVAPDLLPKGKWLHVAGTFDAPSSTLRLYVDGKEVAAAATNVRPLAALDPATQPGVGIGHVQSENYKQYFDGMIAEVRVSDFARKPAELLPFAGARVVPVGEQKIEVYFDRKGFEDRLGGTVRVVDFDDIETTKDQPVAFSSDHYEKDAGIIIKGTDGQYVGQTFGWPEQFVAGSPPNSYAPGPMAQRAAAPPVGGHDTDVTFSVDGKPAAVAGFGTFFIDADLPDAGPSGLAAYDRDGKPLTEEKGFRTTNGGRAFVGMVAADAEGDPVPIISKVHLRTGDSWPAVTNGEGVTLDDFVFSPPVLR